MQPSVFDGLSLDQGEEKIELTYPSAIHPVAKAQQAARGLAVDVSSVESDCWTARFDGVNHNGDDVARTFCARLNDYPAPYPATGLHAHNAQNPLISCIIVINENLPFVESQLIPSILKNSAKHPVELILVFNGSAEPGPSLRRWHPIRSEWGAVADAYNTGADRSRAPILAIFHDDCIVDDPLWIEKCLQRLENDADVVAAEFRQLGNIGDLSFAKLPVAKSVPMVLSRETFFSVGGFDDYHYAGYEDFDFTLSLLTAGKRLVATDLQIRHFNGMSSTLKYNPMANLAHIYALAALPRTAVIRRFREFIEGGGGIRDQGIDYLQLALDTQLLYVFDKHRAFLADIDGERYAAAAESLRRKIGQSGVDINQIVPTLRQLDRPTRIPQ